MKEWTIVGIPPVITAVAALAKAEGNVAAASERSVLSKKWYCKIATDEWCILAPNQNDFLSCVQFRISGALFID